MPVDKDAVRKLVHDAFDSVAVPMEIEGMRLPRYTGEDSYEMVAALVKRKWSQIPVKELFYHRESLVTLSAAGFRAYLPAYLLAAIESDDPLDKYGADIRHYLLASLKHWPHQTDKHRTAETAERLSLLDGRQRAAVAATLELLVSQWESADASELLRDWPGTTR